MSGVWRFARARCPQNGYDLTGEMGQEKPSVPGKQKIGHGQRDDAVRDHSRLVARHKANNCRWLDMPRRRKARF
jgi:hypothetical protein